MSVVAAFFQRISAYINRIRSPSNKEVIEAFVEVVKCIQDEGLNDDIWVCGGALLGFAREGKILNHDVDVDFNYDASLEHEFLKLIDRLVRSGFKYIKPYKNNDQIITQHLLMHGRVKIDFFRIWSTEEGDMQWYCYCHKHWASRPSRQFLNQITSVGLEKINFHGVEVSKPIDHERYLREIYGEWRVPVKDYAYYIDNLSIVKAEPWEG